MKWVLHTVLFPDGWELAYQMSWLRAHGLRTNKVRKTANYYRWRQRAPIPGAIYDTEVTDNGIHLVFMSKGRFKP